MKTLACAAIAACVFSGCWHATRVDKSGQGTLSHSAPQPAGAQGGAAAQPSAARPPPKPGRPPLAVAPGGLFVPGGVEQIQNALASRGYLDPAEVRAGEIDAATSAAVLKFQADQGLAHTGNPDHETVRLLGLDAERLFRKSSAAAQ